jgi:ketosteroid isomerase-like protein
MSKENMEAVLRGYEAFNRGDLEAASAGFDPEIEWVPLDHLPEAAPVRGPEGVRRWWTMWREHMDDFRIEIEEVIDVGDSVIVMTVMHGTGRESGAAVPTPLFAHVWTRRAGRSVRMEMFPSKAAALEAVGLSE